MADNLDLHISGVDAGDAGDQLRAWFWEPPGEPWRCDDFWLEIEMDTCVTTSPEDYPDSFKPRTVGIAHETRSAGPWLDIRTPRDTYRMEADAINNQPVYLWQTLDLQGGELERTPVDLQPGDRLVGSGFEPVGGLLGEAFSLFLVGNCFQELRLCRGGLAL